MLSIQLKVVVLHFPIDYGFRNFENYRLKGILIELAHLKTIKNTLTYIDIIFN